MDVIFTGFEPFGRFDVNPSYAVAKAAAAVLSGLTSVEAHQLSVTWSAAARAHRFALGRKSRVLLVHCGLAGERSTVSIERTALNRIGTTLDNLGKSGHALGDESRRTTRLDAERIAECVAKRSPVGCQVSDDAGDYICNATLWHSLGVADDRINAIFVHVPLCDVENAERIGRALGEGLIEALGIDVITG